MKSILILALALLILLSSGNQINSSVLSFLDREFEETARLAETPEAQTPVPTQTPTPRKPKKTEAPKKTAPPKPTETPEETEAPSEATYTIKVVDQNGDPVPNASISICTDTACEIRKTNKRGQVVYQGAPYAYHILLLKLPKGYSFGGKTDAYTSEKSSTVTFKVKRNS